MKEYSASLVSCLFWLSETRKTAQLLINNMPKDQIKQLAINENIYQVRAVDRAKRIYGVTIKRLESMPEGLVREISDGDIDTVKLLVLISIMKTDLLFFEFVHEAYRSAVILGENTIKDKTIDMFFTEKLEQSEVIKEWSISAIKKLKQCYTKMLFEAGMLSDASKDRNIIIPHVQYGVREMLTQNNLDIYLYALTGEA